MLSEGILVTCLKGGFCGFSCKKKCIEDEDERKMSLKFVRDCGWWWWWWCVCWCCWLWAEGMWSHVTLRYATRLLSPLPLLFFIFLLPPLLLQSSSEDKKKKNKKRTCHAYKTEHRTHIHKTTKVQLGGLGGDKKK